MSAPVELTLYGGPMGQRTYALPELEPGSRVVVRRDGKGTPMRPVVYVVTDREDPRRPGRLIATYEGLASDDDG